jgi:serine protease Do
MKQYLLKVTGLAAIFLSINSAGFAQTEEHKDTANGKLGENEEIIIKPKSDKDVTVTVEIKGGQVFVDGKPVDKFDNDNISVRKKKIMILDGPRIDIGDLGDMDNVMSADGAFRRGGGWSFDGGEANRAFLGVNTVSSDANGVGGAKIREITKGSAAEKAGLQPGDLITRVGEIDVSSPADLSNAIHKFKPEDKVILTFKREGKEQKTTAKLGKFEGHGNSNYNLDMPGIEGYPLTIPPPPRIVQGFRTPFSWNDGRPKLGIKAQDLEEGKGARVLGVDEVSPADKAGIKKGDIITRFDGKDVDNASMLADLAHSTAGKQNIKIGVTRDGKTREIDVKVPKKLRTADL